MSIQRLVTSSTNAARLQQRNGQRDKSMVALCDLIARTMRGAAASELLNQWRCGHLPDQAAIVALPVWLWRPAGVSMGRKDEHGRLLIPVRVHWDGNPPGALIVLPDSDASAANDTRIGWNVDALGVEDAGTTRIRLTDWIGFTGAGNLDEPTDVDVARIIDAPLLNRDEQHRLLCGWIEEGITARWQFLSLLDSALDKALHRAHMALIAEYSEQRYGDPNASTQPVLHEESLEALRNRLVYGGEDDETTDTSVMLRLIADTHNRHLFDNVDPQRWLRVKVGYLARYWVRREIGDPERGPKIRRTARELGINDPHQVAAALTGIGASRVEAALGLAPHPDAGALRFGFGESPDDDAWIEKAARSV